MADEQEATPEYPKTLEDGSVIVTSSGKTQEELDADLAQIDDIERIAKLNESMAKSDLPYHTAETEAIQAERITPVHSPDDAEDSKA